MKSLNNPRDSDSDDSDNSIPRYGGYKHSSARYEDFEMWNWVCEDAEPGWEYKEAQKQEKNQQKQAKKEVARKARGDEEKREAAEARTKKEEETAEAVRRQTRSDASAMTALNSPFNYQRSNHAARLRTQTLIHTLHNNTKELDAALGFEDDRPEARYNNPSR
ncbi:hypothetical protein QM012_000277 [Aureobasidium pullulans]|uniref:Uncharacterized protein n=1 Tax=Aureobasidium pullulans TaxID=5580 RepID=A0ABR0TV64_AURPU